MSAGEQELNNLIVEVVRKTGGIKISDLVLRTELDNHPAMAGFWTIVENLIETRKLKEIRYTLPETDEIKSFLLPMGTVIALTVYLE